MKCFYPAGEPAVGGAAHSMRVIACSALLALLSGSAAAGDLTRPPLHASSTHEIRDWVEARRGFGTPGWEEIDARPERIFVIWNLPTSGLDLNYVYTYRRMDERWSLLDQLYVHGPPRISVEHVPARSEIVYRMRDEVVRRLHLGR